MHTGHYLHGNLTHRMCYFNRVLEVPEELKVFLMDIVCLLEWFQHIIKLICIFYIYSTLLTL